jgi:hypothetical protein
MLHFAMFLFFCDIVFLVLENRSQTKIWVLFFFGTIFRTYRCEFVKESQGGFESSLDYFLQVNG